MKEKKNERGRDENIWRRKRKKYLEMEIIWSAEENKNGEGKGEAYIGEGKIVLNERRKGVKTPKAL